MSTFKFQFQVGPNLFDIVTVKLEICENVCLSKWNLKMSEKYLRRSKILEKKLSASTSYYFPGNLATKSTKIIFSNNAFRVYSVVQMSSCYIHEIMFLEIMILWTFYCALVSNSSFEGVQYQVLYRNSFFSNKFYFPCQQYSNFWIKV